MRPKLFSRVLVAGAAIGLAASFAQAAGPYQLFTLAPCRVVDTRNPTGPLGGPSLAAATTRSFPVTGTCGIPSTAKAVVFNVGPGTHADLVLDVTGYFQ